MALILGELAAKLTVDDARFDKGLKTAEGKFRGFGDKWQGFSDKVRTAGTLAFATGAGAAVAFATQLVPLSNSLGALDVKAKTVFGGQLGTVQKWAEANKLAFGATGREVVNMAAGMADLLKPMGFTEQAATGMSTKMVDLSGALSRWSSGTRSAAEVSEILSAAMLGERDALQGLGISIAQSEIDARLAAKGQAELTGQARQQAEALATQELILEKSTDAQAAWANGGKDAAEKQNALNSKISEAKEKLAGALTPAIEKVTGWLVSLAGWLEKNSGWLLPLAGIVGGVAAALWLVVMATAAWNAVLALNPIALIVIAILLLVGTIVFLATKTQFFQTIWNTVWGGIKDVAGNAKDFIVDKFNALVGFITGLPGRVRSAASGLWDGLKDSFRAAINWLIDRWNNFSLTLGGGSVLGMDIPSVTLNTPNIPRLAGGGDILRTGLAVVHRGEAVIPAAQAGPLGGMQNVRLTGEFTVRGSDLVLVLRDMVQLTGGGDVQAALGQA